MNVIVIGILLLIALFGFIALRAANAPKDSKRSDSSGDTGYSGGTDNMGDCSPGDTGGCDGGGGGD